MRPIIRSLNLPVDGLDRESLVSELMYHAGKPEEEARFWAKEMWSVFDDVFMRFGSGGLASSLDSELRSAKLPYLEEDYARAYLHVHQKGSVEIVLEITLRAEKRTLKFLEENLGVRGLEIECEVSCELFWGRPSRSGDYPNEEKAFIHSVEVGSSGNKRILEASRDRFFDPSILISHIENGLGKLTR